MADLPEPLREGEVMGAYMDFDRTADKTWTSAEYLVRFGQFVSRRTADQLRDYAAAKVAEERERCAQIVREAWSVHGLCCSDAGALADLIHGLDAAAIRGTEATANQRAPLYTEATMLARVERAVAEERAKTLPLIQQCCAALAEELAAWDIDPPLAHVKDAHDACETWLAAIRGTEAASA